MRRLLFLLAVLAPLPLAAEIRTWTDASGRFTTEAELLTIEDQDVRLRKLDGREIVVPLAKLSQPDREFVFSIKPTEALAPADDEPAPAATSQESEPAAVAESAPVSCSLELKRPAPARTAKPGASATAASPSMPGVFPQQFFVQFGLKGASANPAAKAFAAVIQKEPDRYNAEEPFRGVARLGSQQYGFVLDAARPATGSKLPQLTRLIFDLNHNGDLTDDKPILADAPAYTPPVKPTYSAAAKSASTAASGASSRPIRFSRVDLSIEADGAEFDYAFSLEVDVRTSPDFRYATATLSSAAYREGRILLHGKRRRILVIDYNSSGRFNDPFQAIEPRGEGDGRLATGYGDLVLIDPDASTLRAGRAPVGPAPAATPSPISSRSTAATTNSKSPPPAIGSP